MTVICTNEREINGEMKPCGTRYDTRWHHHCPTEGCGGTKHKPFEVVKSTAPKSDDSLAKVYAKN